MAKEEKKEEKEKKQAGRWFAEPPVKSKCSCKSEFQDRTYGVGVRLHARFKSGKRCTVCHNEKLS